MVNEDFPEPETPVTTTICDRMVAVTSFKLCGHLYVNIVVLQLLHQVTVGRNVSFSLYKHICLQRFVWGLKDKKKTIVVRYVYLLHFQVKHKKLSKNLARKLYHYFHSQYPISEAV
jgi:hypothetical protein